MFVLQVGMSGGGNTLDGDQAQLPELTMTHVSFQDFTRGVEWVHTSMYPRIQWANGQVHSMT